MLRNMFLCRQAGLGLLILLPLLLPLLPSARMTGPWHYPNVKTVFLAEGNHKECSGVQPASFIQWRLEAPQTQFIPLFSSIYTQEHPCSCLLGI